MNLGKKDGQKLLNTELTGNERRILLKLVNNPNIPYETL